MVSGEGRGFRPENAKFLKIRKIMFLVKFDEFHDFSKISIFFVNSAFPRAPIPGGGGGQTTALENLNRLRGGVARGPEWRGEFHRSAAPVGSSGRGPNI